jgi:hypothetical protein
MRHLTCRFLTLCALLAAVPALAAENRHDWQINLDFTTRSDDETGKLSVTDDSSFARVALVYEGTITPTLSVDAVVDAVDDGSGGIGVTEAFLTWQPVPRSPFRHRLRVGAFYPPMSLENTESDWSSSYTESSSSINTWVGEELRTIGAEWSVGRTIGPRVRQRELRFLAAMYYANDPAGALLSWRGWSMHERQTRLGDSIVLPPVPQIAPDMMFFQQGTTHEPFEETDHRPGYYYGAELHLGRRTLLKALHYDNHADPLSLQEGNYGWTTRFDHLGAQFELPARLGLILQWIDGTTVMGPAMPPAANGRRVVDNGFRSVFALLTRQWNRHRWSLRFDDFRVTDYDGIPLDDNSESGHALTAAWRYDTAGDWSVGVEWQLLDVTRPAFAYFDEPTHQTVDVLKLGFGYRLRPGR